MCGRQIYVLREKRAFTAGRGTIKEKGGFMMDFHTTAVFFFSARRRHTPRWNAFKSMGPAGGPGGRHLPALCGWSRFRLAPGMCWCWLSWCTPGGYPQCPVCLKICTERTRPAFSLACYGNRHYDDALARKDRGLYGWAQRHARRTPAPGQDGRITGHAWPVWPKPCARPPDRWAGAFGAAAVKKHRCPKPAKPVPKTRMKTNDRCGACCACPAQAIGPDLRGRVQVHP